MSFETTDYVLSASYKRCGVKFNDVSDTTASCTYYGLSCLKWRWCW